MFHELGHEWWGNFLSVADWSDFWIHEGICTYSEVMYVEEKFGQETMHQFVKDRLKKNISNTFPIIPPHGSTAKNKSGNDVYYKAAHVLHSIRYIIGKEILLESLKEFLNMPKELENNQTTTKEFISLLNENSNTNLEWVFNQYMNKNDLPTLLIKEKLKGEKRFVDLRWEDNDFKMPIEISYNAIEGPRTKRLYLDKVPSRFVVPDSTGYVLDPNGWILFNMKKVEGMILMNHGIFTFHDDAKKSYQLMIKLVTKAERFIKKSIRSKKSSKTKLSLPNNSDLSLIRKVVSEWRGCPVNSHFDSSQLACEFANLKNVKSVATRGPLTPDHVIRTKRIPPVSYTHLTLPTNREV